MQFNHRENITDQLVSYQANLSTPANSLEIYLSQDSPSSFRLLSVNPVDEKYGATLYGPVRDLKPGEKVKFGCNPTKRMEKDWEGKMVEVEDEPELKYMHKYSGEWFIVGWWLDNQKILVDQKLFSQYLTFVST